MLGVGSELRGDDLAGIAVARHLQAMALPQGVEVVEGHTGGINLLFDIEDADWAIVVDAVDFGGAPGELAVFEAEDADLFLAQRVASLHHVSLADVLEIARATGLTARVTIVGLQPGDVGLGREMTEAVAGRIEEAARTVADLIAGADASPEAVSPPHEGGAACQEGAR